VNTPFLPLSSSRVRLSDALCVMDTSGVMDMVFSAENSTSFASRYKAISLIGFVLEVGFFVNPTIVSLFFFRHGHPAAGRMAVRVRKRSPMESFSMRHNLMPGHFSSKL